VERAGEKFSHQKEEAGGKGGERDCDTRKGLRSITGGSRGYSEEGIRKLRRHVE